MPQSEQLSLPATVFIVPAGQGLHAFEPCDSAYSPAMHLVHAVDASIEYCPGGQIWQEH